MSALLWLLTVVAGAASSDCSIEGVLLSSSSDLACSTAVSVSALWLAGSGVVGPELLLRYHVRVARVLVVYWAREVT